jgi:hypothetical protein
MSGREQEKAKHRESDIHNFGDGEVQSDLIYADRDM